MTQLFIAPSPPLKKRFLTRRSIGAATLLLLAAMALILGSRYVFDHQAALSAPVRASALTVAVTTPRVETWTEYMDVSGAIAPWQEASVRSLLTGQRLTEINVDVGSVVTRGQQLARYDTTMLVAELARGKAALAQAQAMAQQAQANQARALQLIEGGGISKQDLLQYQTTANVTKAQEAAASAQLILHEIDLQNASVQAPDDGTISARIATLGSVTPIGQELFRLIRQDRLQWEAEVTAAQVSSINIGQKVVVTLPDATRVIGSVRKIAPALDPQSRVALVYADLESGSNARAGMYTGGRISLGESNALVIPASALALHDGRNSVALVVERDGRHYVSLREVEVGRREGSSVEVISGLTAYELIVRAGTSLLNDQDSITLAAGMAMTASFIGLGSHEEAE